MRKPFDYLTKRQAAEPPVETFRQVLLYSALITLLATAAPLLVVAVVVSQFDGMTTNDLLKMLAIAGAIPLLITPPIAYFAMNLFRMVTLTIKRVDDHVRFDAMTGLLNRGHFLDQVRACPDGGTVLVVDADHFKSVNDRFGHDVGDAALKMISQRVREIVASNGIAGRLGGEEFGVYLPSWSIDQAAVVADAICAHVRSHVDNSTGHDLRLTVSVGGAEHRADAMIRDALKVADERLYRAKSEGRDRHILVDPLKRAVAQAA